MRLALTVIAVLGLSAQTAGAQQVRNFIDAGCEVVAGQHTGPTEATIVMVCKEKNVTAEALRKQGSGVLVCKGQIAAEGERSLSSCHFIQ